MIDLVLAFCKSEIFSKKGNCRDGKKIEESSAIHLIPFMQMNRNHDDLRHLSHGGKIAPAGTRCLFYKAGGEGQDVRTF